MGDIAFRPTPRRPDRYNQTVWASFPKYEITLSSSSVLSGCLPSNMNANALGAAPSLCDMFHEMLATILLEYHAAILRATHTDTALHQLRVIRRA